MAVIKQFIIPLLPPSRKKRVGIYCRISTNSVEQLESFTAQVSALTRLRIESEVRVWSI